MKRIVSFFALSATLLLLTACGGGEDVYAILIRSREVMEEAGSMAFNTNIEINIEPEGYQAEYLTYRSTVNLISGNQTTMEMMTTTSEESSLEPGTTEATAWFRNGTMYMDVQGLQWRTATGTTEPMIWVDYAKLTFTEDQIIRQSVETVDDNRKLVFELNTGYAGFLVMLEGMLEMTMADINEALVESTILLEIVIDEEYNMISQSAAFNSVIDVDGVDVTTSSVSEVDFTQVGGVTIEFPAELETFHEL